MLLVALKIITRRKLLVFPAPVVVDKVGQQQIMFRRQVKVAGMLLLVFLFNFIITLPMSLLNTFYFEAYTRLPLLRLWIRVLVMIQYSFTPVRPPKKPFLVNSKNLIYLNLLLKNNWKLLYKNCLVSVSPDRNKSTFVHFFRWFFSHATKIIAWASASFFPATDLPRRTTRPTLVFATTVPPACIETHFFPPWQKGETVSMSNRQPNVLHLNITKYV